MMPDATRTCCQYHRLKDTGKRLSHLAAYALDDESTCRQAMECCPTCWHPLWAPVPWENGAYLAQQDFYCQCHA